MSMIMYYQSVENNQNQGWKKIIESQEDMIRQNEAFHMSIYKLDKEPPTDPDVKSDVRYQGDLWFDIDHKPKEKEPTKEDYQKATRESIVDTLRLLSYLESVKVNPKNCRLFASGGKGFHICVYAKVFGATAPTMELPKLHKYMAGMIQQRAGTTGIDMATYNMGKGKLLRVENKVRANGKYKVPITYEELLSMTPESYDMLTSTPRIENMVMPGGTNDELAILYGEAEAALATIGKLEFAATPTEQMAVFSDGDNPICVQWIVEGHNIKPGQGKFNRAKMSLARYLMASPITDTERDNLIHSFAENWTSTHCPTSDSRRTAVKETLQFGKDNGFSCSLMTQMLDESPCQGCKLRVVQRQAQAEKSQIEVSPTGYVRPGVGKNKETALSNFYLINRVRYINKGDPANSFNALDCDIYQVLAGVDPVVTGKVHLDSSAWQSNAKFKEQIAKITNVSWYGSDVDLQHIKLLLTNETALDEGKTVETVPTIGIHRHLDLDRNIDEFVWVEEDFSINPNGFFDTLKFNGMSNKASNFRTVRLKDVKRYDSKDEAQNETLRNLLNVNIPEIVAPTLGWMISCWLRVHARNDSTDKHLPALQIYGSSGHGKTETATLFAALAGADYVNTEPVVVSSTTPYALKVEAAISTTVPRIFDEMNEHRIIDRARYTQAYEAVKMSARAGIMASGDVSKDKGLTVNNMAATSPLVMLATQLNSATEIHERTIPLSINKVHRNADNTAAFNHVRRNIHHLVSFARSAMEVTISLDVKWVEDAVHRNQALMPENIQDRVGGNWRFALVGLDYFTYILLQEGAPEDILVTVNELKQHMLNYLDVNQDTLSAMSETQEIDNVIDTFGEMIIQDTGYNQRFKHGEHYIVAGDTLHIWSSVFFPQYVKYSRQVLMRSPEMCSIKQYQDLLRHQDYTLGSCPPEGVRSPAGWHSFHIPGLRQRRVRVENFLLE